MPSRVYAVREAAIVWTPTGTPAFAVQSLANNAGRVGARHQIAPAQAAERYLWRCKLSLAAAAAIGNTAAIYLATSDGTDADANLGTGDAALPSLDRTRNLQWIGTIVADAATVGPFKGSGVIEIVAPYVQPVIVNTMGQAFSATTTDHNFSLTPIAMEIQ
jgi:hypothetical protein